MSHHLESALRERDIVIGCVLREGVRGNACRVNIDLHEAGLMVIPEEERRQEMHGKLLPRPLAKLIVPDRADDSGLKPVLRAVEGEVRGSPAEARS